MKFKFLFFSIFCLAVTGEVHAQAVNVIGDETIYRSPWGVLEKCVAIQKLPRGEYKESDLEKEKEYCSIHFYDNTVALCAKTWSTSAATIINDNSKTGLVSEVSEEKHCKLGKGNPLKSLAKFKQTMNAVGEENRATSGTFSLSSLLYYHLSRYLDTTLDVPVAVYRSMDKDAHFLRVTSKANPSPNAQMLSFAWEVMKSALVNPSAYSPFTDLFTVDKKQIFGVILKDAGERYGPELNGTRVSGWGLGQNLDFMKTPAFSSLRSDLPLRTALVMGTQEAFSDARMSAAFKNTPPHPVQMVLWMREVSEIALLDYLLSQQDRIGNIDYRWFVVYANKNGKIETMKVDSNAPRKEMSSVLYTLPKDADLSRYRPILVQKTMIGDNDAGGMPRYANFAKQARMLESLRHLHPKTYKKLIELSQDFEGKGELYQAFSRNFGLNPGQLKQLVDNTKLAASILTKNCEQGLLKFDLVSYKEAFRDEFKTVELNCRNP